MAEWTFTPLGYRPVAGGAIAPTYAVGLPLLMAAVNRAAGYGAVFLIVPVAGALLIVITYALGRDSASPRAALTAAFLTATNATLLGEVTAPMSDVVLAASLLTGLWCLIRRPHPFIAAAGVACGVGRPGTAESRADGVGAGGLVGRAAVVCRRCGLERRASAGRDVSRDGRAWLPGSHVGELAILRLGVRVGIRHAERTCNDARRIPANLAVYVGHVFDTRAQLALVGLGVLALPAPRLWPTATRSRRIAVWLLILSVVAHDLSY